MTDNWYLTSEASVRAVVAGFLGDEALARRSVEHLRPLSGRLAVSGISIVSGPIDGYLAIALAVLDERDGGERVRRAGGGPRDAVGDDGLPAVVRRPARADGVLAPVSARPPSQYRKARASARANRRRTSAYTTR